MSSPNSKFIVVQDVPGAGRGVVSSKSTPKDTLVLTSSRPAAHVVFREYRKEVCAQCFCYDRGRTLPVRHNTTGKVFCTLACKDDWTNEQGEVGLAAWETLHQFIQSRSKTLSSRSISLLEDKPDLDKITTAWTSAEKMSKQCNGQKTSHTKPRNNDISKTRSVDPDTLSYLLSGVLFYYRHPNKWQDHVLDLAGDARPYRDSLDLEDHCNSFVQLSQILSAELLPYCTSQICQDIVSVTSHNSFGLRSGSEDGEEYMGYALYPDASYFNHSCSPNIEKVRTGNVWEFRAIKDIAEGEQCCITYLGGDEDDLTISGRRARLKVHWGFECMCERCVQESQR